jgi:arginine exporter protein ArgO
VVKTGFAICLDHVVVIAIVVGLGAVISSEPVMVQFFILNGVIYFLAVFVVIFLGPFVSTKIRLALKDGEDPEPIFPCTKE